MQLFLETLRHAQMTTPGISTLYCTLLFFLSLFLSTIVCYSLIKRENACARLLAHASTRGVTTLQDVKSLALYCSMFLQQVVMSWISPTCATVAFL